MGGWIYANHLLLLFLLIKISFHEWNHSHHVDLLFLKLGKRLQRQLCWHLQAIPLSVLISIEICMFCEVEIYIFRPVCMAPLWVLRPCLDCLMPNSNLRDSLSFASENRSAEKEKTSLLRSQSPKNLPPRLMCLNEPWLCQHGEQHTGEGGSRMK